MTEPNPYAPPSVAESQTSWMVPWAVQGVSLIVRLGTTLPMVDVETGEVEPEMKPVKRTNYEARPFDSIRQILGFLLCLPIIYFVKSPLLIFGGIVAVSLAHFFVQGHLEKKQKLKTRGAITEFVSAGHQRILHRRRIVKISISTIFVIVLLLMMTSFETRRSPWIAALGFAWIPHTLIMSTIGRRKARTRDGPDGWLMIQPVHPDALAFLREKEREMLQQFHTRSQMSPLLSESAATLYQDVFKAPPGPRGPKA